MAGGFSALGLALGAAMMLAQPVSAAMVDIVVTQFNGNAAGLTLARAAQSAFTAGKALKASEDFEGFTGSPATLNGGAANPATVNPVVTGVGSFASIGPNGCGSSCVTPSGDLQVREGNLGGTNVFGRFNTTAGGENYLDSNDNSGMLWSIPGGVAVGSFDAISFFLMDVDDVGSVTFNITTGNDAVGSTGTVFDARQGNGKLSLVTMLFSEAVDDLTIALNIDAGDGFGIDDIRVSQVPLPAAGLLLLAGLAGLGLSGRRRKAA